MDRLPNEYIEHFIAQNLGVIMCAAADAAHMSSGPFVVLILDLGDRSVDPSRMQQVFNANMQGRAAASAVSVNYALAIIARTADGRAAEFTERVRRPPPDGFVHAMVLSKSFGRLALAYAPLPKPTPA